MVQHVVTTLDVLRFAADLVATTTCTSAHHNVITQAAERLEVFGHPEHTEAVNLCRLPDGSNILDTSEKKLAAILHAISTLKGR